MMCARPFSIQVNQIVTPILMSITLASSSAWLSAEESVHPSGTNPATTVRPHLATGMVGKTFRFSLVFKNQPDHYEAENLPSGLTIDRVTGVISGIPKESGVTMVILSAVNQKGRGGTRVQITVAAAVVAAQVVQAEVKPAIAAVTPVEKFVVTPPAAASGTGPAAAHGKADEEADEPDPYQAVKALLHPWTDNMRRTVENALLPAPTTIIAGDWYYRVIHTAQVPYYRDWQTNLLGLDDDVKIGILLGYGIAKDWDITLQRTNGYQLQTDVNATTPTTFDYYDLMLKHKFVDQYDGALDWGGLADVAFTAGVTDMQRNQGHSLVSFNAALLAERNFIFDRLRLGAGIAFSSVSAYQGIYGHGPATKLFPDEYDALVDAGATPEVKDATSTTAVPVTLTVAISSQWQLFGEAVFPISGYSTGAGPSMTSGLRLNTNTHQYCFFFTNTGNVAFNSVITGGGDRTGLPLFGFYITAFF